MERVLHRLTSKCSLLHLSMARLCRAIDKTASYQELKKVERRKATTGSQTAINRKLTFMLVFHNNQTLPATK
jgi:hypothetical protein